MVPKEECNVLKTTVQDEQCTAIPSATSTDTQCDYQVGEMLIEIFGYFFWFLGKKFTKRGM